MPTLNRNQAGFGYSESDKQEINSIMSIVNIDFKDSSSLPVLVLDWSWILVGRHQPDHCYNGGPIASVLKPINQALPGWQDPLQAEYPSSLMAYPFPP